MKTKSYYPPPRSPSQQSPVETSRPITALLLTTMSSRTTVTTVGAKGRKSTKTVTTSGKGPRRGGSRAGKPEPTFNALTGHFQMLADPCNSTLAESAYRGQSGIPSRFTRSWTASGSADTAYFYQVNPADISAMTFSLANSAAAFTPVTNTLGAGRTFLTNNASSWRVIGYCLDVDYIGTELNRSGKLYTGIIPSSNIPAGVATAVDTLKVLFTNNTRTPDKPLQSKWFPGVTNEDYASAGNSTFINSNNSVCFLAENMPAGVSLSFKETIVLEWIPQPGLGFVTPNALSGTNPIATVERLHQAAKSSPSFVHSFTDAASHELVRYGKVAGRYAVSAGMQGLASLGRSAMRSAAPLLLTL